MFERFLAHGPTAVLCLVLLGAGVIAGIVFLTAWLKKRSYNNVIYHTPRGATDEAFDARDRWEKIDAIAWKLSLSCLILGGLMLLGISAF